ncbi:ATP-binding protein, partial [Niastella populi]|uniref:ATP-binding protein n=1 Tax=Niastella populi TaxID=550983 RepID=UPI001054C78F
MLNVKFTGIYLGDELYNEYKVETQSERLLSNLSQINIFVGKNNSGKSRFLRKLFSQEDLKFLSNVIDLASIDGVIANLKEEVIKTSSLLSEEHSKGIRQIVERLDSFNYLRTYTDFNKIDQTISSIYKFLDQNIQSIGLPRNDILDVIRRFEAYFKENNLATNGVKHFKFERIYMPTLRGLRPLQTTNSNYDSFNGDLDNYYYRTISDYFENDKRSEIYTGLSFYNELNVFKRGTPFQRKLIKNFEQ